MEKDEHSSRNSYERHVRARIKVRGEIRLTVRLAAARIVSCNRSEFSSTLIVLVSRILSRKKKKKNSLILLVLKHSNHPAFPPSFSSLMASSKSLITSLVKASSTSQSFNLAIALRAPFSSPLPSRRRGDSGRSRPPTIRNAPQTS